MTTVLITLPDQLAEQAERAGLLSPAVLEAWLRDQLRTRSREALAQAMERMSAIPSEILTPEEMALEISKMRAEQRAQNNP